MTKSLRTCLLATSLGLLVLAAAGPTARVGAQQTEALAVVVAQHTPVDALSLPELRRVFSGWSIDKHGVKLIPLNHPIRSAARSAFDRAVLNMSPKEAGRHWVSERIRGTRLAPKSVSSTSLLLKVVSRVKGAISYVPMSHVSAGVKVVKIDGHAPGDDGYPIR